MEFLYAKIRHLGQITNCSLLCVNAFIVKISNPPIEFILQWMKNRHERCRRYEMSVLKGKALINLDSEEESLCRILMSAHTFELR